MTRDHRITLSAQTARDVRKRNFVDVHTTFITEDGPANGTIWMDRDSKTRVAMIVEYVNQQRFDGHEFTVDFACGTRLPLKAFMERVSTGRYFLIGCTPTRLSYTEL